MSRTIYTPCHITIFNLFLLSYYISFKRLLNISAAAALPQSVLKRIFSIECAQYAKYVLWISHCSPLVEQCIKLASVAEPV